MKKIPVWKVILLSIVTLGVYPIVWFALRRGELETTYGLKVPHWLWLVLSIVLTPVIALPIIVILGIFTADNATLFPLLVFVVPSLIVLIPFSITVWWVACFSAAMAKAIGGRIPTIWATLLYFFCGFVLPAVQQFYINRFATDTLPKKTVKPTTRFIILATLAIALVAVWDVYSYSAYPMQYEEMRQEAIKAKQESQKIDSLKNRVDTLNREYTECMSDYDYELYSSQEQYDEAIDACEDLRIQRNKAAREYDKVYF